MKLSIIIPVYNEEKTIAKVIKTIAALHIDEIENEVIVVNDGSSDNTGEEIFQVLSRQDKVKVITHEKNLGKGAAVRTGIESANGEYILVQDADLEYNPSYIEKLLEPIRKKQADVVYGTRLRRLPNFSKDERNPLFLLHYFGNRFLSLLTSVLYGVWITDMETGYKLFPRKAVKGIQLYARGFDFEPEITAKILKQGYKILEIPIKTNPRDYDEGKKLNTIRDGTIALFTLLKYRFTD